MENNFLIITTHISPTKGFGGPAMSIRKFVDYLQAESIKYHVYSTTNLKSYVNADTNEFYFKSYISHKLGFSPSLFIRLFFTIKRYDFLIINGIATFPNFLGIFFAHLFNKKVALFSRGSFEMSRYDNNSFFKKIYYDLNFIVLNKLHRRNKLVVIYQSAFEALKSNENFNFTHLVVPNFSINEINRVRKYFKLDKQIDIIYCGRDSIEKGTDRLLSFLKFLQSYEKYLKIIIIVDGPVFHLSELNCEKYNHSITILNSLQHEEVLQYLSYSKYYFFGSRIENFGNSFIEAILCGSIPIMFKDTDWSYLISKDLVWEYDDFISFILEKGSFPEYDFEKNKNLFNLIFHDHFENSNNYSDIIEILDEI